MSLTVCPVTANDVAHLHRWKWENPPDGIYALMGGSAAMACVHVFDLEIEPVDGRSPFPICGMGGIATHPNLRSRGHASMLLNQVIADHLDVNDGVEGFLLNGQPGEGLWHHLGFQDVGESHTAPLQRLWWLPRPGVELFKGFSIEPVGFHW